MSVPQTFPIPTRASGRLYVMPMPDPDALHAQIAALKDTGIDHLVCLMQPDEQTVLGLSHEEAECKGQGIDYTQFPIQDFGLPDGQAFLKLAAALHREITEGISVLIHCKGGIGRSGMLSSLIAAFELGDIDAAIEHVAKARGVSVPDTEDQKRFIQDLFQTEQKRP
ncbi:MAG: hypothetical protein AAF826_07490 [Pseudomonadota bacterium]